uniref:Uncharacterized protein n=1 Tax=Sphaerodactylus townsendi TaxID=933632 RepID=A0ACB8EV87_9SAUR
MRTPLHCLFLYLGNGQQTLLQIWGASFRFCWVATVANGRSSSPKSLLVPRGAGGGKEPAADKCAPHSGSLLLSALLCAPTGPDPGLGGVQILTISVLWMERPSFPPQCSAAKETQELSVEGDARFTRPPPSQPFGHQAPVCRWLSPGPESGRGGRAFLLLLIAGVLDAMLRPRGAERGWRS